MAIDEIRIATPEAVGNSYMFCSWIASQSRPSYASKKSAKSTFNHIRSIRTYLTYGPRHHYDRSACSLCAAMAHTPRSAARAGPQREGSLMLVAQLDKEGHEIGAPIASARRHRRVLPVSMFESSRGGASPRNGCSRKADAHEAQSSGVKRKGGNSAICYGIPIEPVRGTS